MATQQILTSVHDCFTELNILICDFIAKLCVVFHLCLFEFWNLFYLLFFSSSWNVKQKVQEEKSHEDLISSQFKFHTKAARMVAGVKSGAKYK